MQNLKEIFYSHIIYKLFVYLSRFYSKTCFQWKKLLSCFATERCFYHYIVAVVFISEHDRDSGFVENILFSFTQLILMLQKHKVEDLKRQVEALKYEKEFLNSDLKNHKEETKNLRKMFTKSQEILSRRFKEFDLDKNTFDSLGSTVNSK